MEMPEIVIMEILSWLPVKTLLQFKSVSRSWYAIITSSYFISKHLENYYNNSDYGCLLDQRYVTYAELGLFKMLVDHTPRVLSYQQQVYYYLPIRGSYIYGPCDGIFYLYHYYNVDRALWNPATKELKVLPPLITKPNLPSNIIQDYHDVYGFGLDPVSGYFKVIVIKGYRRVTDEGSEFEINYPSSVFVFSLRTNSWRYWGDLTTNCALENNKSYIFVNGVSYWLASYELNGTFMVMISFDMAADVVQEIYLPSSDDSTRKSLALHHGSIALLTFHEIEKFLDIWTLSENCWIKKVTIGPLLQVRWPIGHWKNNQLILEYHRNNLLICDPYTEETWLLEFQGLEAHTGCACKGIFVYMESLVSVKDKDGLTAHEDAETAN